MNPEEAENKLHKLIIEQNSIFKQEKEDLNSDDNDDPDDHFRR